MQADVTQAALDLATQVGRLKAAGAQYVDRADAAGRGQDARGCSQAARPRRAPLTGLTGLFNSTLNAAIGAAGLQVIQFNTFKLAERDDREPGAVRLS